MKGKFESWEREMGTLESVFFLLYLFQTHMNGRTLEVSNPMSCLEKYYGSTKKKCYTCPNASEKYVNFLNI